MAIGETLRRETAVGVDVERERAAGLDEPSPGPRLAAYLHALARLQGLLGRSPVPLVVVAGACRGPAAARVAEGLEEAARASGLRTMLAELESLVPHPVLKLKRPVVRGDAGELPPRTAMALADPSPGTALALDARAMPALVERWFARVGGSLDLVLVEAPPLDLSLSGALLAKAGDGLVIAFDGGVTPGESLGRAADLARAAGCPMLGLVMSGGGRGWPAWLSRLLGPPARRPRQAAG
jgi:hypothetical protein